MTFFLRIPLFSELELLLTFSIPCYCTFSCLSSSIHRLGVSYLVYPYNDGWPFLVFSRIDRSYMRPLGTFYTGFETKRLGIMWDNGCMVEKLSRFHMIQTKSNKNLVITGTWVAYGIIKVRYHNVMMSCFPLWLRNGGWFSAQNERHAAAATRPSDFCASEPLRLPWAPVVL